MVVSSTRAFSQSSSVHCSPVPSFILISASSSFLTHAASLFRRSAVLVSAARTSSTAELSLALASCSTRMTSQFFGIGNSRAAKNLKSVVFPCPFGPKMPYLLPCTMVSFALLNNVCLGAMMVKPSTEKLSPADGGSFFPPGSEMEKALRVVSFSNISSSFVHSLFPFSCFSIISFSFLVNFSPFSFFSKAACSFSSASAFFLSSSFAGAFSAFFLSRASAASLLFLSSASSSSSSTAPKGFAAKSGNTKQIRASRLAGGFGIFTVREFGSL
mmetsp:Transcript_101924/g.186075  ORF Transcript_101924/g.186075 Transcript_101924/m.186075 type:complete len:272 (+) Transcript_101924:215-1030(+)